MNWKHNDRPELGFMNGFSASVERMERKFPGLIPDFDRADTIVIGSDYGGEHRSATYEVTSFVFSTLEECKKWESHRQEVRQDEIGDERRMEYKKLNDGIRDAALLPFLRAADNLEGLLLVVMFSKDIDSMFEEEGKLDTSRPEFEGLDHWKLKPLEKLLRIVHIVGCFLEGLSSEGQNVLWFTDRDEIVPNEERAKEATQIFESISSQYLTHDLGSALISTTEADSGDRRVEDFVSVADLSAGAMGKLMTEVDTQDLLRHGPMSIIPPPDDLEDKVQKIRNWFADDSQPLKRLLYVIDEEENSTRLHQSCLRFQKVD